MSNHSNLSPSKRSRWSRCPGSIRMEGNYPDERTNDAAIQGTHTHTLLNWCCKGEDGMLRDPMTQVGFTLSDEDGEFMVDAQRAKRVEFALDYIMQRKIEIECKRLLSEERVNGSSVFGRDDLAGTCDLILEGVDVLEIADYKDGMSYVAAKGNEQMEQYLINYLAPWIATGSTLPWKKIRMTIIQPKLRDKGMTGIDYHEISVDDVPGIQFAIQMEAAATDDPNAPLIPGETQCKYCKHAPACSALNNQAMKSVGIASESLKVAQQAADKEPTTLSDDQLREILEAAPLLRQLLEGAEKEAATRLMSGRKIVGLKLVKGKGSRQWRFPEDEMASKLVKFGIPKSEIYKTTLVSPAQTEKLVWQKKDGTHKQLSERQLKTMKEEYIVVSEGKTQVALASDSRPEINADVSSMFAPVGHEVPSFLQIPDFLK